MNRLPTELLHHVFNELPIIQKKECTLVCRQWANIILASCLFHTVYIDKPKHFKKFLSLLAPNLEQVFQVESLTINCVPDDCDKREFILLFPHLIEINFQSAGLSRPNNYVTTDQQEESRLRTGTCKRIRHLRDFYDCELTRLFIEKKLCSHLTTLQLDVDMIDKHKPWVAFPLLKDMPILEALSIHRCSIAIDDFEILHDNLPSLKSLKLKKVKVLESTIPQNITPSKSLTRLDIRLNYDNWLGMNILLQYIRRKYVNLKHFSCDISCVYNNSKVQNVYETQYPLLLQEIGPQLDSLVLFGSLDPRCTVIKGLDSYGCQIKELDIRDGGYSDTFDALVTTNQQKNIKKLSLSEVDLDQDITRLKYMEKLKTLRLEFVELDPFALYSESEEDEIQRFRRDITVDLYDIFESISESVDSITISQLYVGLENDERGGKQTFGMKEVAFEHIEPQQGWRLDQFISDCFPCMHTLRVSDCFEGGEHIMLPDHHMSEIAITRFYCEINVCLITKNRTSYYTIERLPHSYSDLENLILPVSRDEIGEAPYITIICASLKKLYLNGTETFLLFNECKFQSLMK